MGIIIAIIVGASEYFIQYALRPQVKEEVAGEWFDSVRACGALRDTFIVSRESGESLHAWYVKADSATCNVAVIVHGYTDSGMLMAPYAEIYDRYLGYNILLPDLHYHGQSQGEYVQMGWKDRIDILQWCALADSIFGGSTHQVLHGISMGAATVMCVSGETLPEYVRCFVEDCGYTSVWDEYANELRNQFSLPPFPLLYTTSWLNKIQNGWSFSEASPLRQVAKCNLPMLFIHGGSDEFVKTEMVHRLFAIKPGIKQLKIFENTDHAASFPRHKEEYSRLVRDFVSKYNK